MKPSPLHHGSEEILQVGAFDAKTHLSKLLRQARAGKRIVITQHGKPVAELGPVTGSAHRQESPWGDMQGQIRISDDFCEELEDFKPFFT